VICSPTLHRRIICKQTPPLSNTGIDFTETILRLFQTSAYLRFTGCSPSTILNNVYLPPHRWYRHPAVATETP